MQMDYRQMKKIHDIILTIPGKKIRLMNRSLLLKVATYGRAKTVQGNLQIVLSVKKENFLFRKCRKFHLMNGGMLP